MLYLYVKTHNVTGLKYLGKTSQKDPFKYKGSGVYWRNHLKQHGNNVTTEIIFESENKDEIRAMGLYFSDLLDIVNSNDWANLKVEEGEGGFRPDLNIGRSRPLGVTLKIHNKKILNGTLGRNNTSKMVETRRRNGSFAVNSKPETISKIKQTKLQNGSTLRGRKQSPETIAKRTGTPRGPYKKSI